MDRRNLSEILWLPCLMLLVGFLRHYGWDWFPLDLKGLASKGLGGLALLTLVWVVFWLKPVRLLLPVALWWSWEELQVVLCSFWFMFDPWPVPTGKAMCSARVGFDTGALGLLIVAVLAYRLAVPVNSYRLQK